MPPQWRREPERRETRLGSRALDSNGARVLCCHAAEAAARPGPDPSAPPVGHHTSRSTSEHRAPVHRPRVGVGRHDRHDVVQDEPRGADRLGCVFATGVHGVSEAQADPALRDRAVQRYARKVVDPQRPDLSRQLADSAARALGLFAGLEPVKGQPVLASQITCTLSCDHRAVDGALGAELLAAFKALVENPVMMLV